MPVRDGAPFLGQAVESILSQTHRRLELIIVDDGSKDDSAGIATGYAAQDHRVRVLHSKGKGIVPALETGLSVAAGQWIARMDCDDIAVPQRLATQIAFMQENGVDICGAFVATFGAEQRRYRFPECHQAICSELVFRCALMHPAVVIRRDVLQDEGYRKEAVFEDYDLWTRLALRYVLGNVQQVLLYHRRHPQQIQAVRSRELIQSMTAVRFRYIHSRYPNISLDDYMALCRLCECRPASSLLDFGRAGQWLVQLAEVGDPYVRSRMALRWKDHWTRSRVLGGRIDGIYFKYQKEFEAGITSGKSCSVRKKADPGYDISGLDRVEVDLTSSCPLNCHGCNRSCGRAPSREQLAPEQFKRFLDQSVSLGRHWKVITLMGGEPTHHEDLELFFDIALDYKRRYPCVVELATSGYGSKARRVIRSVPKWVQIRNGDKTGPVQNFIPFCIAPKDMPACMTADFSSGCRLPGIHGVGFSRHGIYPCGPGAAIDRVLGFQVAIHDLGRLTPAAMAYQKKKLCAMCGHFGAKSPTHLQGGKLQWNCQQDSPESISWRRAYRAYKLTPPRLALFDGADDAAH